MSNDHSVERADDNPVSRVIAELTERLKRGEPLDRSEIIRLHPSLAAELAKFFDSNGGSERPADTTRTQFLVEEANRPGNVVPSAEVDTGRTGGDTPGDAPKSRLVMERLGKYVIIRPLGEGGMGSVYLARDTRLGRLVAVKIPHIPAVADPIHRARFVREAQSVAQLRHANVCPVYDVDEADGVPYIAMAYIEGQTLAAQLAVKKAFEPQKAVELVLKLADALQHAHEEQIVHRDLKPANIMMDQRGNEPIIMDFGLALKLNQSDSPRMTLRGMVMGTPAYMAPEQIVGGPDEICAATDIYSLGVILFELLTGRTPFIGSSTEVMAQTLKDDPPSANKLQPEVDADLDQICRRMLSKHSKDRYPSMSSVSDALKSYLNSRNSWHAAETSFLKPPIVLDGLTEETKAMPSGGTVAAAPPAKSHRTLIISACVVAFAAAAALAGMLMQAKPDNVTVHIDDSVASDLLVLIDKKPLAFADEDIKLALEPGTHRWSVLRGEWVVRTDEFVVAEGQEAGVTVTLKQEPATEPPAPPKPEIVRTHEVAGGVIADLTVVPRESTLIYATSNKISSWDFLKGGDAKTIAFSDPDPIQSLVCDPSGKFLAVGLGSKVRIIEISTGKEIKSLPHHGQRTTKLIYSPDGTFLAAEILEEKISIWNVSADYKSTELPEAAHRGTAIAFSPDSRILASGHRDGLVRLWNVKSNALERTLEPAMKSIRCMTFSPDGSTLSVGNGEKIRRFDTSNWTERPAMTGHSDDIFTVLAHPAGGQLVTGSRDNSLRFWNVKSASEVERRLYDKSVTELALSSDGQTLLDCAGPTIHVWRLPVSLLLPPIPGNFATLMDHTGSVNTVDFSPDGRLLVSGSFTGDPATSDSDLRLWDVASRKLVRTLLSKIKGLLKARFSSDGRIVAALSEEGNFQFWDVATGERKHSFDGVGYGSIGTGTVRDFDFVPGRDQLVVVGSEGHSVIRLSDLKEIAHWKAHDEKLTTVATFSDAHSSWLLSGSDTGMIRAWSIPLVTESYSLPGTNAAVDALRVTPDGLWAISGKTGAYWIWNLNERQSLHKLVKLSPGGPNLGQGVAAISADGARALLVTPVPSQMLVAFDVASGDPVEKYPDPGKGTIASVAISPDGRLAASGGADGKVMLWTLPEKINSERRAAEWVLSIAGNLSERRTMRTKGEISDPALLAADPLECLYITLDNNHRVTDDGLKNLSGLSQLRTLRLTNTPVTDAGLRNLNGLPMLDMLSLEGTAITDSGLDDLHDFKNIRFLSLSKTKITGQGLNRLIGLPRLRILHLEGTGISDEHLPSLEGLRELDDLYLDQTQVSDKGIEQLKRLEQLQLISLRGSQVTPAGIQELQKALPHLKILPAE